MLTVVNSTQSNKKLIISTSEFLQIDFHHFSGTLPDKPEVSMFTFIHVNTTVRLITAADRMGDLIGRAAAAADGPTDGRTIRYPCDR